MRTTQNKTGKNQSSQTLALLIGAGSLLAPILIVVCCLYSLYFLILYTSLWIIAQVYEHRIRQLLNKHGIASLFDLCRKHKEKVTEYIETLNEPKFINPSHLPFQELVTEHYKSIREEVLDNVTRQSESFTNAYNNSILSTSDSWKACSILGWGLRTSSSFPVTEKLMHQIGAVNCNVSRLAAGTDIRSHHGETNAFTRCHLPLVVPATLPVAGMVVGGEKRSWVEGELLAFIDLNLHGAFNNSTRDRIVLIFDVIRPELEPYRSLCCARWLIFYTFAVLNDSIAIFPGIGRLRKGWRALFSLIAEPPLSLVLLVYFRWFCRESPFWFRIHKNTGFYF